MVVSQVRFMKTRIWQKKCSNSIEHFISGEFSLAIQITPEDETEIKVPASKPTTTNSSTKPKSKTPPPPPPPLTPEEIAEIQTLIRK